MSSQSAGLAEVEDQPGSRCASGTSISAAD